jgi:hypothetical protein
MRSVWLQCGCECIKCTVTTLGSTSAFEVSTDPAVCNPNVFTSRGGANRDVHCTMRNKENCAAQFSTPEQAGFCSIKQPSKWPPIYDINNGVNYTLPDGSGPRDAAEEQSESLPGTSSGNDETLLDDYEFNATGPIYGEAQFMYTGQTPFGDAAMHRFVRDPQLQLIKTDEAVASDLEVSTVLETTCPKHLRMNFFRFASLHAVHSCDLGSIHLKSIPLKCIHVHTTTCNLSKPVPFLLVETVLHAHSIYERLIPGLQREKGIADTFCSTSRLHIRFQCAFPAGVGLGHNNAPRWASSRPCNCRQKGDLYDVAQLLLSYVSHQSNHCWWW